MSTPIYIAATGLARTGKNLFCDIAARQLYDKYKLTSGVYPLAYELKSDCEKFILEKLGLNVFTEITEEKNIFRPLLVCYADIKRKQTNGRYWLELLDKRIRNEHVDVVFISDLRFAEYPKDEVFWLKEELHGKLVHINKFTYGFPTNGRHVRVINDKTKKIFVDPPNQTEAVNDPKVKKYADYCIEWEDIGGTNQINDPYLNTMVSQCLDVIVKL